MANVTLSIEDDLLKKSRKYAQAHDVSLNRLVRRLLKQTVLENQNAERLEECFDLADKANGHSRGKAWKREDLYDV